MTADIYIKAELEAAVEWLRAGDNFRAWCGRLRPSSEALEALGLAESPPEPHSAEPGGEHPYSLKGSV